MACLREAEALAAALDDPRRLGRVLRFVARQCYYESAHDQAIATAQRALTLVAAGGDAVLYALANQDLGNFYQAQGHYRRAMDCFTQTMVCLDGARRRERFAELIFPAVYTPAWRAWCHAELGTFAEGRALAEEGLRLAEEVAHPPSLLTVSWGLGLLCLRQGDLPKALPLLERSMHLCQEVALSALFPMVAAALGAAYTLVGRLAAAVPVLTEAIEQAMTMGRRVFQAHCRLALSEALCWRAAWTRPTPWRSRRWSLLVCTTNGATRPGACGCMARSPCTASPPTSSWRYPLTSRPSPSPTRWACVRSRPTATAGSARCMLRPASASRPAPRYLQPWRCTGPWR